MKVEAWRKKEKRRDMEQYRPRKKREMCRTMTHSFTENVTFGRATVNGGRQERRRKGNSV